MGSNVTQWLTALERIASLNVDWVIPGHGQVVKPAYLSRQRANLLDWVRAVADAVAAGWSWEDTVEKINFADRYPVDVGQGYMMNHIQTLNARVAVGQAHIRAAGLTTSPRGGLRVA